MRSRSCRWKNRWRIYGHQNLLPQKEKIMRYTYILQCADGTLYTGITTDLARRVHEHNHSPKGATYTKAKRPVTLVRSEASDTRSEASARECAIKKLTREQKITLITQTTNPL